MRAAKGVKAADFLLKATRASFRTGTFLFLGTAWNKQAALVGLPPNLSSISAGIHKSISDPWVISAVLGESYQLPSVTWALLRVLGQPPGPQRGDAGRVRLEQGNRLVWGLTAGGMLVQ